jgi:propanol-preferring alcohol dehydrogenase
MADYLLVPSARFLVPLPAGLAPEIAAPLTDAGLTSHHALSRAERVLQPGATAAVLGVGGLGHLAVQMLKGKPGLRVVAIDVRESALKLATACGADHVVHGADTAALAELGREVDAVFDFVGVDSTLATAANLIAADGHIGLIGVADGSLPVSARGLPAGVTAGFTYWGSRNDLVEVLALAAAGHVAPEVQTFTLDEAPEAYAALRAGEINGRAVVRPTH